MSYADFYALMPPDNSATVAPGTDVSFPQNGPIANTSIGCLGPSSFNLGPIGTYQILFQVSVTEAGQLILTRKNKSKNESEQLRKKRNCSDLFYLVETERL